ncbi:hypothetical protein BC835DRAFT_1302773 [Cytidiella melzeri]|nr:hypothetical protein BC835DRAFT_1302773 [Cytidiella melzeri]
MIRADNFDKYFSDWCSMLQGNHGQQPSDQARSTPPRSHTDTSSRTSPRPADNSTPQTYKIWTPTPPQGWPIVHINHPLGRLSYLSPTGILSVLDDDSDPVLAYIWDAKTQAHNSDTAAELLKSLSQLLLPHERPAVRAIPANSQCDGIGIMCISNLSSDAKSFLLEQTVFLMRDPRITFSVFEPFHSHQTFLTMFAGYSDVRDRAAVHQNLVNAILTTQFMSELLAEATDTHPHYSSTRTVEALHALVSTARTTILDLRTPSGQRAPRVCLYMDIPTEDVDRWRLIRNQIRLLAFVGPNGELLKSHDLDTPCSGCGVFDHLRTICPFQEIPEWNGTSLPRQPHCLDKERTTSSQPRNKCTRTDHQDPHEILIALGPYNAPPRTTPVASN